MIINSNIFMRVMLFGEAYINAKLYELQVH